MVEPTLWDSAIIHSMYERKFVKPLPPVGPGETSEERWARRQREAELTRGTVLRDVLSVPVRLLRAMLHRR